MRTIIAAALASCLLALTAIQAPAFAWGATGHHIINVLAAGTLPDDMPAFMRTTPAIREIMDLGLELDLMKGAGKAWDADLDPGHYLDLQDNGTVEGVVPLDKLPATREAYDTALRAGGSDQYKAGYAPYSIVEGWQELRMVFAYWRVDHYESLHAKTDRLREIGAFRAGIDEQLARRDAGVWGHYVGDAAQPLHMTVHFNGWGKYPNPHGYSNSTHLHDLFETVFVDRYMRPSVVMPYMTPPAVAPQTHLTNGKTIMTAVEKYLAASNATVPQLYQIEKAGGFKHGTPQAKAFVAQRLAFGASELRTLIVWAWRDSLNVTLGDDAPQKVRDIVSGKVIYAGMK